MTSTSVPTTQKLTVDVIASFLTVETFLRASLIRAGNQRSHNLFTFGRQRNFRRRSISMLGRPTIGMWRLILALIWLRMTAGFSPCLPSRSSGAILRCRITSTSLFSSSPPPRQPRRMLKKVSSVQSGRHVLT